MFVNVSRVSKGFKRGVTYHATVECSTQGFRRERLGKKGSNDGDVAETEWVRER